MAADQIRFSQPALAFCVMIGALCATALIGISLNLDPGQSVRPLGFLTLFGPNATCYVLLAFGAFMVVFSLASLRRLVGNKIAVATGPGGIEVNGLFFSRRVPWASVERISVRVYKFGDQTTHFIHLRSSCPVGMNPLLHALASLSYGLSEKLLSSSTANLIAWVARAEDTRVKSLSPRPAPQPSGPTFGRRDPRRV